MSDDSNAALSDDSSSKVVPAGGLAVADSEADAGPPSDDATEAPDAVTGPPSEDAAETTSTEDATGTTPAAPAPDPQDAGAADPADFDGLQHGFLDLDEDEPKPVLGHEIDWDRVKRVAADLNAIVDEMNVLFPERRDVNEMIRRALLSREHIIIYGESGTGKTNLVDTWLDCIKGLRPQDYFRMMITKSTTESEVYGPINPKTLREKGILWRDKFGTLLDSFFANIDEFLDGASWVLRGTLGPLNERRYERGRQRERLQLRTCFASTNWSPRRRIEEAEELIAVLDRFLFHATVHRLKEVASRLLMYRKFRRNVKPESSVSFADLDYVSWIVTSPADQLSDTLLVTFDEVIVEIRKHWESQKVAWKPITDRTLNKLLQQVEANALINGRYEAIPEDILAIRWAVCEGGKPEQFEAFDRIAGPIIQRATEAMITNPDQNARQLLEKYEQDLPPFVEDHSPEGLVNLWRKLGDTQLEVQKINPQLELTKQKKREILERITNLISNVQNEIAHPTQK